jgi:osmotically-inducible protein OsmY
MKTLKPACALLALVSIGSLVGCSTHSSKAPDLSSTLRTSLDQAGLKDVTSSQDREKGVVTLGGHVGADHDKAQAESIARSLAGSEVVANEIAVTPAGESDAKAVNSNLDKGIEGNLDAALIEAKLKHHVKFTVKNGLVTLTGEVDSAAKRAEGQRIAASIQNVNQVVNELQVKDQKATSSN